MLTQSIKKTSLILLLLPALAFGQKTVMDSITYEYCQRIQQLDWESSTPQQMYHQIDAEAAQLKRDFEKEIEEIKQNYSSTAKDSAIDPEKRFNYELSVAIIYQCDAYIAATRNFLAPCPEENHSLKLMAKHISKFMTANAEVNFSEQLMKADNELFAYAIDMEETIKKDYPDGISDPNLVDDIGPFLLHHCDPYYKAFLADKAAVYKQ